MSGTDQLAGTVVRQFKSPKRALGEIDAEIAAGIITATADIALVLDKKGVIRDLACENEEIARNWCNAWIGKAWADTVTIESQAKITEMLQDAVGSVRPRWRQVNHPSGQGADLPVQYIAMSLGGDGRVIAVGRDLRTVASLQQRLVHAQQSLEQEYQKLRQVETRYRALFHLTSEAIIIADATSLKIVEANPAATRMLANGSKRIVGRTFTELLSRTSSALMQGYLQRVRTSSREETTTITAETSSRDYQLTASLLRQENASYFLFRLLLAETESTRGDSWRAKSSLIEVVERLPDAFVVADKDRRILSANSAFIELVQLANEAQVKGEPIDRWLGRVEVDADVLMNNLREHGTLRQYQTVIRGAYGSVEDVEVSAVYVPEGHPPCFGITIRKPGRQPLPQQQRQSSSAPVITQSADQLAALIGRKPLKDIVRQTSDIIEKLCISAALELTSDNRASAAEMLGLSRQSLYVKMRHLGLE